MRAEDRNAKLSDIKERYAEQAEDTLVFCLHEIGKYFKEQDRTKLQHIKLTLQNAAEMIQKYQDKLKDFGG